MKAQSKYWLKKIPVERNIRQAASLNKFLALETNRDTLQPFYNLIYRPG
jgi:dynactin complex subunit